MRMAAPAWYDRPLAGGLDSETRSTEDFGNMPDADQLLKQALQLDPEARAALAGCLLDSLDSGLDPDAEAEWEREIERRLKELDEGKTRLVPWSKARRIIAGME